jgi:hypothetical protein
LQNCSSRQVDLGHSPFQYRGQEVIVEVQLIDLGNVTFLPKGLRIEEMLAGNENWRSPEANFKSELNKPTDIFSFGIM